MTCNRETVMVNKWLPEALQHIALNALTPIPNSLGAPSKPAQTPKRSEQIR